MFGAGWSLFRSFFGAPGHNAVMPPTPRIHLRLRFVDPMGVLRDFPPNYPLRVRFGDGGTAQFDSPPIQAGGLVFFDAKTTGPWQYFTLEFPATGIPYIVCEPLGSPPASPPQFHLAAALAGATGAGQRFFRLPQTWQLRQADWSPPVFSGNGRFDSPPGRIYHTLSPPANISIGTPANPVILVLNPHWHFTRFEYYDRYWGNAHLDSPPRPAHRRRISIPQIGVEGFRADPNAAGSPPDTHSNWAIDLGSGSLLQALPFIERRTATGAAISPPDGTRLGLRFKTQPNTVVYSHTDQARILAVSPPPGPQADRLRYYDLPAMWKSRQYYTRRVISSPPAPGKFFQTLTAAEIAQAENRANPLVFCLDDMVLYTATGAALNPLPALAATDRVAIFGHRFTNELPNSGNQGLYKGMPSGSAGTPLELPFSNVVLTNNYLADYPDWTRLVVTQGNLFDVFDRRTPDHASATRVVGARAAVRWLDTGGPVGISVFNNAGTNLGAIALTPNRARSSTGIGSGGVFPPRVDSSPPFFSLQPFYGQFRPDSRFQLYNAASPPLLRGRFDMALLRCSDVENNNEVAVNLHYIKSFFNFLSPPASPPQYAQRLNQNVMDRWSGNETPPGNDSRTVLLAQLSPPGLRAPKTQVVWYCQSVTNPRAHCAVDVVNINRANRETIMGAGASGPTNDLPSGGTIGFASAHECGHMDGLPDEYNERWRGQTATSPLGPASYGEIGLAQNLPGDPYEPDDTILGISSIMNRNEMPRNRHFWHAAEWVRRIYGTPMRVQKDNTFINYVLPRFQHPTQTDRAYYPWPMLAPLNQSNPASPVSRFDLYLHAMGVEAYSASLLPGSSLASPFDGVLEIIVRLHCNLPANATKATENTNRRAMLNRITSAVSNQLNNRWFATGTANYGTPPTARTFQRCLIEFRVGVVVTNHPFDATAAGAVAPVVTGFPRHFTLRITSPPSSPPAFPFSPPGRLLTVHVPTVATNPAPAFMALFPRMLGINSPPPPAKGSPFTVGSMDSADIQPIVNLVMPGATVTRFQ